MYTCNAEINFPEQTVKEEVSVKEEPVKEEECAREGFCPFAYSVPEELLIAPIPSPPDALFASFLVGAALGAVLTLCLSSVKEE